MKLLYVSSVDQRVRAGYYYAVMDRIDAIRGMEGIELICVNYSSVKESSSFEYNIYKPFFLFQRYVFSYLENYYLYIKMLTVLRETKPEVVHVHWCYPIGLAVVKACNDLGIKCVMTAHGSDIHSNPAKSSYIRKCTIEALVYSDLVLFVSSSLRDYAVEKFELSSAKNYFVAPNFLDESAYKKVLTATLGRRKTVVFVGNLNQTKGADRIATIFEGIKECSGYEFRFIVAGDGLFRKSLDSTGYIETLGHIDRAGARSIINEADLVVVPSRSEGFGLVPLESFMLETPCVAFSIDGLKDVFLGNEGLLAADGDIDDFVRLCVKVLNGELLAITKRYPKDYGLQSVMGKEMSHYARLICH
ncbi:MAG: glycosyltransferase family 4 protein [Cycloclasticus sp.]|jgi:Glycosyltransferase